jgi:hypothetical protein
VAIFIKEKQRGVALSKLFGLRKWLGLEEVAKYLSKELVEDVSLRDVLRLALDRNLTIALLGNVGREYFVDTVNAKSDKEWQRLDSGPWELVHNNALKTTLQNRINSLEVLANGSVYPFEFVAIVANQGETATLYGRHNDISLWQMLQERYEDDLAVMGNFSAPSVEDETVRLASDYFHRDWFFEVNELMYLDKLVVTKEALDELTVLLVASKYLPSASLKLASDSHKKPVTPESIVEPSVSSTNPNESEQLRVLRLAAQMFWANANRDDKTTHPKNAKVEEWLKANPRNFNARLATAGATLIRPKWAARGRPSEE